MRHHRPEEQRFPTSGAAATAARMTRFTHRTTGASAASQSITGIASNVKVSPRSADSFFSKHVWRTTSHQRHTRQDRGSATDWNSTLMITRSLPSASLPRRPPIPASPMSSSAMTMERLKPMPVSSRLLQMYSLHAKPQYSLSIKFPTGGCHRLSASIRRHTACARCSMLLSARLKAKIPQVSMRIDEICRCKIRGRGECMSRIHGSHIYRMILLIQFDAKCWSYEFRATSIEEATVVARQAALEKKSWFIRVSEITYPTKNALSLRTEG